MALDILMGLLVSLSLMFIGLGFGCVATYSFYKHFQVWQNARRSKTWPDCPGRVSSAQIVWQGVRNAHPQPTIEYNYQVNDSEYQGKRIAFTYAPAYTREEVEALIERYAKGSTVTVYYDPAQPQESTLEQKPHGLGSGLIVNAVLLFSPTAFCWCIGLIGLADVWQK